MESVLIEIGDRKAERDLLSDSSNSSSSFEAHGGGSQGDSTSSDVTSDGADEDEEDSSSDDAAGDSGTMFANVQAISQESAGMPALVGAKRTVCGLAPVPDED